MWSRLSPGTSVLTAPIMVRCLLLRESPSNRALPFSMPCVRFSSAVAAHWGVCGPLVRARLKTRLGSLDLVVTRFGPVLDFEMLEYVGCSRRPLATWPQPGGVFVFRPRGTEMHGNRSAGPSPSPPISGRAREIGLSLSWIAGIRFASAPAVSLRTYGSLQSAPRSNHLAILDIQVTCFGPVCDLWVVE